VTGIGFLYQSKAEGFVRKVHLSGEKVLEFVPGECGPLLLTQGVSEEFSSYIYKVLLLKMHTVNQQKKIYLNKVLQGTLVIVTLVTKWSTALKPSSAWPSCTLPCPRFHSTWLLITLQMGKTRQQHFTQMNKTNFTNTVTNQH
jgi:hypothetical protein